MKPADFEPLSPEDVQAIAQQELRHATNYTTTDLAKERSRALEAYLGKPIDELASQANQPDRSKVTSSDVEEVIEWILPSLVKKFTAEQPVEFEATEVSNPMLREQREAQARQETDYCSYVWEKDNDSFPLTYTWFKDALLQKNGILKVCWELEDERTREDYSNLSEMEVMQLLNDPNVQPVAGQEHMLMTPQGPMPVYDLTLEHKYQEGRCKIRAVAPEDFGINRDHRSSTLEDVRFVYDRSIQTRADLVAAGYDRDTVWDVPKWENWYNEEWLARRNYTEERFSVNNVQAALDRVEVYDCYALMDVDGDGMAEWVRVVLGGYVDGAILLDYEVVDSHPYVGICPVILTHKFYGRSIADRVMDLYKIKSTLWRQSLDNLYRLNNHRTVAGKQVNIEDLLVSRPGGVVQVDTEGPVNAQVMPLPVQPMIDQSLGMMNYADSVRENRTGVGENAFGLAEKVLGSNKGDLTVERMMSAKESQVDLIARIFAEYGFRPLFQRIRELVAKHQDKARIVKLRGEWTPVDPAGWRGKYSMRVRVGLGTGDRNMQLAALQQVSERQAQLIQMGHYGTLVTDRGLYEAQKDWLELLDLRGKDYFVDPASPEYQQALMQKQQQAQLEQSQQAAMFERQASIEERAQLIDSQQKEMDSQRGFMIDSYNAATKRADVEFKHDEQVKTEVVQ